MLPIAEYLDPIHKHMVHTGRILVWFVELGVILNLGWIEYDHICEIACS